jgi:hypothetical protein
MPGLAHISIALGLCMLMTKYTKGKFGIKHSLIFTLNCLVGPDLASIFFGYTGNGYLLIHGYGWFIAAVPLSFAWCVYTYYSLKWKPFTVTKRDSQKEPVINYAEVFCLVSAGGIFHQMVDIIGHPPEIMYEGELIPWGTVWFGGDNFYSVNSIWATGMYPCGNELGFPEFYVYLAITLCIAVFLLIKFIHRNEKMFFKVSMIIILVFSIPLIITYFIHDYSGFNIYGLNVNYYGDPSYVPSTYRLTGGEADLGVLVFFFLFLFVPLILLYFGYNGVPGIKKTAIRTEIEKIEREEHEKVQQRIQELLNEKRG